MHMQHLEVPLGKLASSWVLYAYGTSGSIYFFEKVTRMGSKEPLGVLPFDTSRSDSGKCTAGNLLHFILHLELLNLKLSPVDPRVPFF